MTKEKREIWQGGDRIWMIADINFMNKDKIDNKKYFPVVYPDCGNKTGHLYEHRYEAGKEAGGMWVWCSACHNYEHYRARLPKWWKNPDFIEFGKLCHQPDYLEEHKDDIDKWVNSLLLADWSDENVQDIKQEIISLLREKLPESLQPDVDEVELLIMQNKNRQAWLKMDEIKKNPLWSPTNEYVDLMEKSWYYLLIGHN